MELSPTKFCARCAFQGQHLKQGRLVPLEPDENAVISGAAIIEALEQHGLPLERFEPRCFSQPHQGWSTLRPDAQFQFSDSCNRLDVVLHDKAVSSGGWSSSRASKMSGKGVGYFGIGIHRGKAEPNHGTLWRSAFQLGASYIFTIGARHGFEKSVEGSADTAKAWTRLPFFKYADMDSFCSTAPYDAPWVAVESGGTDLADFEHPPRAVYILGSEDHGLPPDVLAACPLRVSLDSVRSCSYNVAVAGSILMYDRQCKVGLPAASPFAEMQSREELLADVGATAEACDDGVMHENAAHTK